MAVKRKDFQANTVLKASEVEQVQDNGVIQCNTVAELDSLPDTVRLAFVTADESVYVYKSGVWKKFVGAGANPLGAIMAYGLNNNPPAGWQICNGGAAQGPLAAIMGTVPNLINRTIVGIGSGHAYNTADGTSSNTVTPTTTNHTHSFSSSHAHGTSTSHAHTYTRGVSHRHYLYFKNASMTKKAGSSDAYARLDYDVNLSSSTLLAIGYAGQATSTTNSNTAGTSTNNGTASGTTGGVTASGNQTLDNYPPNRAFHWIIYNGSDV